MILLSQEVVTSPVRINFPITIDNTCHVIDSKDKWDIIVSEGWMLKNLPLEICAEFYLGLDKLESDNLNIIPNKKFRKDYPISTEYRILPMSVSFSKPMFYVDSTNEDSKESKSILEDILSIQEEYQKNAKWKWRF